MTALERVLDRLKNVHQEGRGYKASYPAPTHGLGRGDRNPSLSINTDAEGNVLLRCFANCETETVVSALDLRIADLFEQRNGHRTGAGGGGSLIPSGSSSTHQPATLENYAAYVGLPVDFLKELGLGEIRYDGEPAVKMPYLDESGEEVLLTRFRVSLTGKPKVKTKKGDKHCLYGEPAVGIPGASGWKAEWASELDGIERLYFVVEDEAGEACWRKLVATPEIRERLYRVELDGVKDVSELHKQGPEGFRRRLREAREGARAWLDIAETEEQEKAREALASCQELAESPDIL